METDRKRRARAASTETPDAEEEEAQYLESQTRILQSKCPVMMTLSEQTRSLQ